MARFFVSLLMLGVIAAVIALRLRDHSPGPLASVHASVEALHGSDGCERCHGPTGSEGWSACYACHAEIEEQVSKTTGFHGQLANAERCANCHVEHRGDDVPLVRERSFAIAGYDEAASYDHAGLDFDLHGRHDALTCVDCHPNALRATLEPGQRRFLGLEDGCEHCHEDVHRGTRPSCEDCHSQEAPFARADRFTHDPRFPLTGSHAGHDCSRCHAEDGEHSVRELTSRASSSSVRSCDRCHVQPHTDAFLQRIGNDAGIPPESSCTVCHAIDETSFAVRPEAFPRAAHDATDFALTGPHRDVECAACHPGLSTPREAEPDLLAFAKRFPGRRAANCESCHTDPHAGQFARPDGRTDCASCHPGNTFARPEVTLEQHAAFGFPLRGAHAQAACDACHGTQRNREGRSFRRYRGTPASCAACHEHPHGRQIEDSIGHPRSCSSCHTEEDFTASVLTNAEHESFSGFALVSAHARLACSQCHDPRHLEPRERIFFSVKLKGLGRTCADCHASPHGNQFWSADGNSCLRCHDQEAFLPARFGLEEHRRSDFPLDGAHAATACSRCHVPLAHAGDLVPFRGLPRECASCHRDAHAGFFEERDPGRGGDCARCHGTSSFADVPHFDHGLETGFALVGAHAIPRCEACHARTAEDEFGRTLGRAVNDCASCHVDPHAGQFREGSRTDCARCHASREDWSPLHFDHARTAFPLDERHAALACSECHQAWALADGTRVTRYKPLGTRCSDCHGGRKSDDRRDD